MIREMASRYESGKSFRAVADEFGVASSTVKRAVVSAGVPIRPLGSAIRVDLSTRKFGRLTPIEPIYGGKATKWKCICECGTEKTIHYNSLVTGTIRSCGCLQRDERTARRIGYGEIRGRYYYGIKQRAKNAELDFTVSAKELWLLFLRQNRRCALTGLPIALKKSKHDRAEQTASLDRKDSTLGYISRNVQWVHKDANRMKWEFSHEYFIEMCRLVVAHEDSRTR
jgi:hypothetical protein